MDQLDPLKTFHTLRVIYVPIPQVYHDVRVSDILPGAEDDPILEEAKRIVLEEFLKAGWVKPETTIGDLVVAVLP